MNCLPWSQQAHRVHIGDLADVLPNGRWVPYLLHPAWFPGRRMLAERDSHLIAIDPFTGKQTLFSRVVLPALHRNSSDPVFSVSPNGRYVALDSLRPTPLAIWNTHTDRIVRRVRSKSALVPGEWWGDSRTLEVGDGETAYLLDTRTGRTHSVPRLLHMYDAPSFSLNGREMVYEGGPTGTCVTNGVRLYFMRTNGRGVHAAGGPKVAGDHLDPIWAADGAAIVFTRDMVNCFSPSHSRTDIWVAELR